MSQPNVRFLLSHPAHFIALGFGSGLAPKAPGTFGTLAAFPLFWLVRLTSLPEQLGIVAAAILIGIWACDLTGRHLGVHDSGHIVWDEIAAFVLVLIFTPQSAVWMAYAFGLFRLFDIWKPFPIGWLDRRIRGGPGVMLDDLLAAGYAVLVLSITVHLAP
ncbi:MAG: phosphatidylglycerophosphatase A [Thiobacillaceae bacterium]